MKDAPEPRGIVVCVRETEVNESWNPDLVRGHVDCAECGERCVISIETVKLLKDPTIKAQCEICSGPKVALDVFSGEGAYLAPGTWDEVRRHVSEY